MKFRENYADNRYYLNDRDCSICVFCDKEAGTDEHIPAKGAFLTKPYPDNLHTVRVCNDCNNKSSNDEERVGFILRYLKLIEEGRTGELDNYFLTERRMKNEDLLFEALDIDINGNPFINIDKELFIRVLEKYSKGHIFYELGIRLLDVPSRMSFAFKSQIDSKRLAEFNKTFISAVYPEVGSRLLQRIIEENGNNWQTVQEGYYRYYVTYTPKISIRIVINEILFCEISWEE